MIKCCICGATPKNSQNLSFHKFPTDVVKRVVWLQVSFLTERDIKPSYMRVCSRHFDDNDYDSTLWPRKVLLKTSVPKVKYPYNISKRFNPDQEAGPSTQPQVLERPKPQKKEVDKAVGEEAVHEEQQELVVNQPVNISKERLSFDARFIGELQTADFSTPRIAKRNLQFIKNSMETQRNKIKLFYKQKKRLEGCINSLQELLETLRDEKLLNEDIANNIMEGTPSSLQEILKR